MKLSGASLVADGKATEDPTQSFNTVEYDPEPATCTNRQAVYVSAPMDRDIVIAGNFRLDLTLASTLPDGNVAALLFHKDQIDVCTDPKPPPANPLDGYLYAPFEARRALVDLRHINDQPAGADFPVATPTKVTMHSHPLSSRVAKGERLILAVGGYVRELFPETRRPTLTISGGSITLPVYSGEPVFASEPEPDDRTESLRAQTEPSSPVEALAIGTEIREATAAGRSDKEILEAITEKFGPDAVAPDTVESSWNRWWVSGRLGHAGRGRVSTRLRAASASGTGDQLEPRVGGSSVGSAQQAPAEGAEPRTPVRLVAQESHASSW